MLRAGTPPTAISYPSLRNRPLAGALRRRRATQQLAVGGARDAQPVAQLDSVAGCSSWLQHRAAEGVRARPRCWQQDHHLGLIIYYHADVQSRGVSALWRGQSRERLRAQRARAASARAQDGPAGPASPCGLQLGPKTRPAQLARPDSARAQDGPAIGCVAVDSDGVPGVALSAHPTGGRPPPTLVHIPNNQSLNSPQLPRVVPAERARVRPLGCSGCVLGLGAEHCVFACCVAQASTSGSHRTAPPRRVPPVLVLRRLGEHRLLPYPSQ